MLLATLTGVASSFKEVVIDLASQVVLISLSHPRNIKTGGDSLITANSDEETEIAYDGGLLIGLKGHPYCHLPLHSPILSHRLG